MTATTKWIFLLAAAAVLPSCGGTHDRHEWIHVTVSNAGNADADVHTETQYGSWGTWEDHLDWSAPAGETSEFHLNHDNLSRLKIRIQRSADHLQIFEESWDRDELEDLDLHVSITIHP